MEELKATYNNGVVYGLADDMPLKEQQEKFMEMSDENIDYSDIPPLNDEFFKNAKLVKLNPQTEQKPKVSLD